MSDFSSGDFRPYSYTGTIPKYMYNAGVYYTDKPTITAVNLPTVSQGELSQATQTVNKDFPGLVWVFYDYTGTPGVFNEFSETGLLSVREVQAGEFTIKARAAWNFGQSNEITISLTVDPIVLTRDTMFGGIDGMQVSANLTGTFRTSYIVMEGAVVDDEGIFKFDDGIIVADSANCHAFWDESTASLLAFRYDVTGTLEAPYVWESITGQPTNGTVIASPGTLWTADAGQQTAAENSTYFGKRLPNAGVGDVLLGAIYYLEITPSGSEFDNFGSSGSDWSFGFLLTDDWVAHGGAGVMLSPNGTDAYLGAITGHGDSSANPLEFINYGNSTTGPINTDTNGATWNIETNNWVVASAGDLVIVVHSDIANAFYVYIEGTLTYSNSDATSTMSATTTPTVLEFGNLAGVNVDNYPTNSNYPTGWYPRLEYLFIANGTDFEQAQVTELTANKADITASANYGSIGTYATFDADGVTSVKGGATYARKAINL